MAHAKRVSKRKRRRIALPALGAAGVSLVMAGGAAATAPTTNVPSLQDSSLRPVIALAEEEIADVSLATFHIFGKENESELGQGIRLAARGCGGAAGAAEAAQRPGAEAGAAEAAQRLGAQAGAAESCAVAAEAAQAGG